MISRLLALVLLATAVTRVEAGGQQTPSADSIISRYVEAIGGRAAHTDAESVRASGTIEMAAMGLSGDFELRQVAGGSSLTRASIPGVGDILSGVDGEVAWSVDPLSGPRVLSGEEAEVARERATLLATVRDATLVPERETVGLSEHDGEECWRVRLVWASGRESFDCYSTETGLLIAAEGSQPTQMGDVQVTTTYREYTDFEGGIRLPSRIIQRSMGQVQEMVLEDVEVNTLTREAIAPPASIEALLDRSPDP